MVNYCTHGQTHEVHVAFHPAHGKAPRHARYRVRHLPDLPSYQEILAAVERFLDSE